MQRKTERYETTNTVEARAIAQKNNMSQQIYIVKQMNTL